MGSTTAPQHYGKMSMILHWLMLALFVGVYGFVELKGMLPKGSALRSFSMGMHALCGMAIFALVWLRLLGRLKPAPAITPKPAFWQTAAARLMHLALYGLMIVTPILAWLMLASGDKPVPYFGFVLPAPVAVDPQFARTLKDWHETVGNTGYALIALHAVAGLFHHYWVKDNTLRRMLPWATSK